MGANLYDASNQWASRPADERFASLQEMHDACANYRRSAAEATVRFDQLRVAVSGEPGEPQDLRLTGPTGAPAAFTNWSFGQLARRVQAPAEYLGRLPAPLAADCLNSGLARIGTDGADSRALFHANGSLVVRAFTSDKYSRIWNCDITGRLLDLQAHGWRVPPARPASADQPGARPATEADCLRMREGGGGLAINPGDMIAPAGLYASAHDCFVFMVNEDVRIDDGSAGGLSRGFFVSNSEVGAAAFRLLEFYYRHVCGNHIVWDVSNVREFKLRHVGSAADVFSGRMVAELRRYADSSQGDALARIAACKRFTLGDSKEKVIDYLFNRGILPKRTLDAAYTACEQTEPDLNPRSAWGMMQGITHVSQREPFADKRAAIDAAAAKVAQFAF
ncbi:MAG: hypothetical protein AB7O59_24525 [Pirellulales bacterium]